MKPRLIDRILLAFILLVFIGIMIVLILGVAGVIEKELVVNIVGAYGHQGWGLALTVGTGAVALALIIIAVKLMFTSSKPREPIGGAMTLLASDENGSAYISVSTIDSLAQKQIKSNNRVKECKTLVRILADGSVTLDVKLVVLADTNIPELCSKMRSELKTYIEDYSGVTMTQIVVIVTNIYQASIARVS